MKKIVLVTQIEFWKSGRGSVSRVQALIRFLARESNLTILCLAEKNYDIASAEKLFPDTRIIGVFRKNNNAAASLRQLKEFFYAERFDIAIIEYLILYWIVDLLPETTTSILDSHDILSARAKSFREHNRTAYYTISEEQEFQLFEKFHKVMFIQEEEYGVGKAVLKKAQPLLCPHPVEGKKLPSGTVNVVGFIGSTGQANRDALIWLNDEIVPLVITQDARFQVFGSIVQDRELASRCGRLEFTGMVDELEDFYSRITIAVNPVIFGGGLKIKNIEAMAFGIPLITTRVGAQGLTEQAGKSYLLATTAADFAARIDSLLQSAEQRQYLSNNAMEFIRNNMSPAACFSDILA